MISQGGKARKMSKLVYNVGVDEKSFMSLFVKTILVSYFKVNIIFCNLCVLVAA